VGHDFITSNWKYLSRRNYCYDTGCSPVGVEKMTDKQAFLIRGPSTDDGTFGKFHFGEHIVFSGELPDRDNACNISCIPVGEYLCKWTYSPRFKRGMYLVTQVDGRSGIRFHTANYMGDVNLGKKNHLAGCIALAMKTGIMGGQRAILNSRTAIRKFELWGDGEDFKLEIV